MNRNALTEQRRETVIGLLKSMDIKKSADGGFDKDDVYECMQQLCDLYEKNIEDLENAYEGEIGQLKDRYQKYDENNELYVSLIMEAKKSSNDIIAQAKTEVENILLEGKEQVALQEKELEQMRKDVDVEKQVMTTELNAAREAVEAEKIALKAELDAEREKATATRNKYTQQINAMEEEFEEIKTNILRTAGKIDSLKSKLPHDEEAEWNMMNDLDTVGFAAEDIEIESIIDAPADLSAIEVDGIKLPEGEAFSEYEYAAEEAELTSEGELTLEDLTGSNNADHKEEVEEIDFAEIEIEIPEISEEASEEASDEEPEEISLEGLEELFKEEK